MNRVRAHVLPLLFIIGVVFCARSAAPAGSVTTDERKSVGMVVFERFASGAALSMPKHARLVPRGTAFCIWSTPSKSYFLTADHVIEDSGHPRSEPFGIPGHPQPEIFGIPGHPGPFKAKVLMHDDDTSGGSDRPDYAVLEIDEGGIPFVKIAAGNPDPDLHRAVDALGFPQSAVYAWESCERLHAQPGGFACPNGIYPTPKVLSGGKVAGGLPPFYIQFTSADVDFGNSGGPLFDEESGDVYGVVESYNALPKPISSILQSAAPRAINNAATSMFELLPRINIDPVHPQVDASSSAYVIKRQGFGSSAAVSQKCNMGIARLSRAYGEWTHYHSVLDTIATLAASPKTTSLRKELLAAAESARSSERRRRSLANAAVSDVESSGSIATAQLASALYADLKVADARDEVIVQQITAGVRNGGKSATNIDMSALEAANAKLQNDADDLYSQGTCKISG